MAHQLRERDAEEHARLRAGDAREEIFPPHAGIDDHGHGAELEEREGRGDERQSLPHHHEDTVALPHPLPPEQLHPGVDLGVELAEGQREVIDASVTGASARDLDRRPVGLACRHERQVSGNIGGFVHDEITLPRRFVI